MDSLRACIFDLDGVLVDTAKYHFLAWKETADSLNIPFDHHDNEQLKGVGRRESLSFILKKGNKNLTEVEIEALLDTKNKLYLSYVNTMKEDEVLPGVLEFLYELKNNHIKIGLGSASKNAKLILDKCHISNYFQAIVDGTNIKKSKPDPEVFLLGAEALGVSADDVVVFEDALSGIDAAKSAGSIAIGVGDAKILTNADAVIPSFPGFNLARLHAILKSIKT